MAEFLAILDFETLKIEPRPAYPPKPIGLAWEVAGERGYERCRTQSEWQRCAKMVKDWYREGRVGVFHHAGFDLDVAETHLGVAWPAEHHDTLILSYLFDPRAPTFALKPMAEKVLGEKPDERDALRDWLLTNVPGATKATWGAYISEAPYELVKPYAIGDVTRTRKLLHHFLKELKSERRMAEAYRRERRLTRVLVKIERRGVPVAVKALRRDSGAWRAQKMEIERQLFTDLKIPKARRNEDFAWSGKNFAADLLRSGIIDELPLTPKGNPSTSADNLGPLIPPKIAHRLELRSQLQTCVSTFADAWLAQAENGGRFFAHYNQVRQDSRDGRSMVGTTTGRLSMTPNLQNVIRSDKGDEVPQLRRYLIPLGGYWWLKLDYKQQEFRLLAHFEDGELLARYRMNPAMDAHVVTGEVLYEKAGVKLERRATKDINFGVIYGMGMDKMAKKLGLDDITARRTLAAYHRALPGIKILQKQLKECAAAGEPIYTWGGRRYYVEPPKMKNVVRHGVKRLIMQEYDYKLLNIEVQGSAADATKEAMVRYDESGWNEDDRGPLLLQVHDELDAMAAKGLERQAMEKLREAMESIEVDVPLLTDRSASLKSWNDVRDVAW